MISFATLSERQRFYLLLALLQARQKARLGTHTANLAIREDYRTELQEFESLIRSLLPWFAARSLASLGLNDNRGQHPNEGTSDQTGQKQTPH